MNTYDIDTLQIEFVRSFKKEYNDFNETSYYPYIPFYNEQCKDYIGTNKSCGVYQMVEFLRKDPMGYIKIKGKDLWLHEENGRLFFDCIKCKDWGDRQPLVCWFEYLRNNSFLIYKHTIFGSGEVLYMQYVEDPKTKKITIGWVVRMNNATVFVFPTIKWRDYSWFKLGDEDAKPI